MAELNKLNKALNKKFGDQVAAREDGGRLVLSGKLNSWRDVVYAGKIAASESRYTNLVNEILCTGEKPIPIRKPNIEDAALEWEEPDVLIIGGGVVGCAIARELSRHKLNILLVEKEHDIAIHASSRNGGIINSGVMLKRGTQKHKYNRRGNQMFSKLCSELGIEFERSGQLLYFQNRLWNPFMFLSLLRRKLEGQKDVMIVSKDELKKSEPTLSNNVRSTLFYPRAGIVSPIDLTLALAENAVQNGVHISFDTMVQAMTVEDGIIRKVKTNRGTVIPKLVINAAGAFCEDIAAIAGDRFFSVHPQKGTYIVIDKDHAPQLPHTPISPIPKRKGKKKRHVRNCSITRTIDGSLLIGPDMFETINKEDFSTLLPNIRDILEAERKICSKLSDKQILSYFSGIASPTYTDDFIVSKGRQVYNIIHAAGITSPGLTAAPAIAADIAGFSLEFLKKSGEVEENPEFNPVRITPPKPSKMNLEKRSKLIESNPDYGVIICKCEQISRGEIIEALGRNVKCNTLDGVKRRTKIGTGKCQGCTCEPQVLSIIASEKHLSLHHVKKGIGGSEVLLGKLKSKPAKIKSASYGSSPTSFNIPEKILSDEDQILESHLKKIAEHGMDTIIQVIREDSADDGTI